jgi:hypothetical protein
MGRSRKAEKARISGSQKLFLIPYRPVYPRYAGGFCGGNGGDPITPRAADSRSSAVFLLPAIGLAAPFLSVL